MQGPGSDIQASSPLGIRLSVPRVADSGLVSSCFSPPITFPIAENKLAAFPESFDSPVSDNPAELLQRHVAGQNSRPLPCVAVIDDLCQIHPFGLAFELDAYLVDYQQVRISEFLDNLGFVYSLTLPGFLDCPYHLDRFCHENRCQSCRDEIIHNASAQMV